AVERVRDGARAVIAGVLPGAVSAAPLVRLVPDLVRGPDDRLDGVRCLGRRVREPVLEHRAAAADRGMPLAARGRCGLRRYATGGPLTDDRDAGAAGRGVGGRGGSDGESSGQRERGSPAAGTVPHLTCARQIAAGT